MIRVVAILLCLFGLPIAQAQQPAPPAVVIKVDPVDLIRKASAKVQRSFKVSDRDAVAQMDAMLVEQYSARGRISNERDAYLKALYHQAATLLMNGYPIAGGTVVSVARNEAKFRESPAGAGMAAFVDAMLQPTDEDPELEDLYKRMARARKPLQGLRPDLRFYADLWVVGAIYRDDIAVEAGQLGVEAMKGTTAERNLIRAALAVK